MLYRNSFVRAKRVTRQKRDSMSRVIVFAVTAFLLIIFALRRQTREDTESKTDGTASPPPNASSCPTEMLGLKAIEDIPCTSQGKGKRRPRLCFHLNDSHIPDEIRENLDKECGKYFAKKNVNGAWKYKPCEFRDAKCKAQLGELKSFPVSYPLHCRTSGMTRQTRC